MDGFCPNTEPPARHLHVVTGTHSPVTAGLDPYWDPEPRIEPLRRPSPIDDLLERVGSPAALDALHADPLPDEPFDWGVVEDRDRAFVADALPLVDACCDELLDVEFRTICRRILARVCKLDPRPLRRSANRHRFAAGLVWLAGRANGEFARHSRVRADLLWSHLDVTSSSAERAWSIRTAAGLVPEPRSWWPYNARESSIALGHAELLHSRTRRELVLRRDAVRAMLAPGIVEDGLPGYRYADHPHPAERDQEHVHIRVDDDGMRCECLWAEPVGDNRYRLLNVVCASQDYGLHDVVLALVVGSDPVPEVVTLVERRTHVRFEFELPDDHGIDEAAVGDGIAICRVSACGYVANAPDRTVAAAFRTYLERHATWYSALDVTSEPLP